MRSISVPPVAAAESD